MKLVGLPETVSRMTDATKGIYEETEQRYKRKKGFSNEIMPRQTLCEGS